MAVEGSAGDLLNVVVLLGAAVVAVPLFKKLGLGSVLGYLAAGLAIGPFGFGVFTDAQSILHVAELGVVMFLFVIGLGDAALAPVGAATPDIWAGQPAVPGLWRAADAGGYCVWFLSARVVCQCHGFCADLHRHRHAVAG